MMEAKEVLQEMSRSDWRKGYLAALSDVLAHVQGSGRVYPPYIYTFIAEKARAMDVEVTAAEKRLKESQSGAV
jgi:hypothetical protein